MKVELFPFQQRHLKNLRMNLSECIGSYERTGSPQVISFTAPTGAGKTIIMSALIESVYNGDEVYPDSPDSIFIWLSDSPELNQQSRMKLENMADQIRMGQLVTITDDSFDQEDLEDGHIYFLNTQKLSASSDLTKHGDARTYTIWETLANTVQDKADHLYVIIDEAHRGMQDKKAGKATSIMQKFIKGSEKDYLPPMPVVIGMSATTERFNKLVEGTTSTIHKVIITTDEVRASGLLKDRIIIKYPTEKKGNFDMAVLQAATEEWMNKWDHWHQYCQEQHYAQVNPVFIVQVQNGTGKSISDTDLNDCLAKIEERAGYHFSKGQVVHTFGQTMGPVMMNGLEVPYWEPSHIADNKNIRVVFFKENLSTGWDCPRAETMMSFRHAKDTTYIAQLLGRMIRTPMQQHINVDDTLNDMHLYLPYFDKENVKEVVDSLKNEEGGDLPTDIYGDEMGDDSQLVTWTADPKPKTVPATPVEPVPSHGEYKNTGAGAGQNTPYSESSEGNTSGGSTQEIPHREQREENHPATPKDGKGMADLFTAPSEVNPGQTDHQPQPDQHNEESDQEPEPAINRPEIVRFINHAGLLTYRVRQVAISDYLVSLLNLTHVLTQSGIYSDAVHDVRNQIVDMIHEYNESLRENGTYNELSVRVQKFKMESESFDVFGQRMKTTTGDEMISITDSDLDRQFNAADRKLGNDGIHKAYGKKYYDWAHPVDFKVDVILFALNDGCIEHLRSFAKKKFHELKDRYRRYIVSQPDRVKKQYNGIVSDADPVSEHNFELPVNIEVREDRGGKPYRTHLFVNEKTGIARFTLNTWEAGVIEEESKQPDYVCFIRNPNKAGSWGLSIPYQKNGETKATHPDFLVVRRDPQTKYVIDILEPHNPEFKDNLPKAQAFARYAQQNPGLGRIELIRKAKDPLGRDRFIRLDLAKGLVHEKVIEATTNEELDHIFDTDGYFLDSKKD